MAYPFPIRTTGPIHSGDDIFEYFKGATQAAFNGENQLEYIIDRFWGDFIEEFTNGNYPIQRSVFDGMVYDHFPDGEDLNGGENPWEGYPSGYVNDWGKIRSIALCLFGTSTGLGTDISLSHLTGSRKNVSGWSGYNLAYLRLGLSRFPDYGCYTTDPRVPPPTNPVSNVSNRTFNWTPAAGHLGTNRYEYRINFDPWSTATQRPLVIPPLVRVPFGGIQLRTKGTDYLLPSNYIRNTTTFPAESIVIDLQLNCASGPGGVMYWYAGTDTNYNVPFDVTVSGTATYTLSDSSTYPFSFSITTPQGSNGSADQAPTGGPIGTVVSVDIDSIDVSPHEYDGTEITLNY